MNATAISSALAARAEDVCRHYLPGGRKRGRYWVAGDIDGTKGRSLYVRLAPPGTPGKWNDAANGDHGDLLDIIRHRSNARSLGDALQEARRFLAVPEPASSGAGTDDYDSTAAALRLWNRSKPLRGSHAEAYLLARGIRTPPCPSLRFNRSTPYRNGDRTRSMPAMIAAVTRNDGVITGVQRTWLDQRSPAKAPVDSPRKALGRIHGHAVRFAPISAGTALVLGEGIETALSLAMALPNVPAAAALSAGSMAAFVLPPDLGHLIVAADNDPEGISAAERLAARAHAIDLRTTIVLPRHDDFNADLAAIGHAALSRRLKEQLRLPE